MRCRLGGECHVLMKALKSEHRSSGIHPTETILPPASECAGQAMILAAKSSITCSVTSVDGPEKVQFGLTPRPDNRAFRLPGLA